MTGSVRCACTQREAQLLARLRDLEAQLQQALAARADLDRACSELEVALQHERGKLGSGQTVMELHAVIASLKAAVALKEQEAKLAKVWGALRGARARVGLGMGPCVRGRRVSDGALALYADEGPRCTLPAPPDMLPCIADAGAPEHNRCRSRGGEQGGVGE